MQRVHLLAIAGLLVLCGCQDPFEAEAQPALSAAAQRVLDDVGTLNYYDPTDRSHLSPSELASWRQARRACHRGVVAAVIHATSLSEAHARVEAHFAESAGASSASCQQMAAAAVLKGHVIPNDRAIDVGEEEIVAHYARAFVESENPEVVTLQQALASMERRGMGALGQEVAASALTYLDENREHLVGCVACDATTSIRLRAAQKASGVGDAIRAIRQQAGR